MTISDLDIIIRIIELFYPNFRTLKSKILRTKNKTQCVFIVVLLSLSTKLLKTEEFNQCSKYREHLYTNQSLFMQEKTKCKNEKRLKKKDSHRFR